MAHTLQINAKTRLIEIKAREILQRIQNDYDNGKIKSETEYLYQVYNGLRSFYQSIGTPSMKVRPAWGPPYSRDYNDTMAEIYQDLLTLFAETDQLGEGINESFRQVEIDRQNLSNRLKKIEDSMKELQEKRTQRPNEIIFRDSFISQDLFDKDSAEKAPANIWTREGVLTIQPTSAQSHTEDVAIRILEGNGFPGNTHQIRSISGTLKFVGEENLHINLAEILDGNLDTWFEYELFDVPDSTLESTSGLGFQYKEGIQWITESDLSLRLVLELELPIAKPINWFSLSPFLPSDKGVTSPVIKSIKIGDGKGKVTEIIEDEESFNEEKVYLFTQQSCKKITISLEQNGAYATDVGHLYFTETDELSMNYLDAKNTEGGKRTDGPLPSISTVGLRYNPETRTIHQPEMAEGDSIENLNERKQELFTLPQTSGSVLTGFESLPAWRYMIGIRDAAASNYVFGEEGEYRTKDFYSAYPIKAVSLAVDEYVPKEFGEGDWVEYSISIDDGQNWHPILPKQSRKAGKVLYLFNTGMPKEGRLDEFGYIENDGPVHQLRLRIILKRPNSEEGAKFYTPIIRDWQMRVVTEGEENQ